MEAHFGLGKAATVDVTVTLLSGRTYTFNGLAADQPHQLDLGTK